MPGKEFSPTSIDTVPELDLDPERLVAVNVCGESFELPLNEAIDAAFIAATLTGTPGTYLKILAGRKTNPETHTAHLLTLTLLSESIDINTVELAEELGIKPAKLLASVDEGFDKIEEGGEENTFKILETKYLKLLRGQELNFYVSGSTNQKEELSKQQIKQILRAQSGDIDATAAIAEEFVGLFEEVKDKIPPDVNIPDQDVSNVIHRILNDFIKKFDPQSTSSFSSELKIELESQLSKLQSIASSAKRRNMHHFLNEVVEFEEECSEITKDVDPKLDEATVDTIISGAHKFIVDLLHNARSVVDGVPISSTSILKPSRKAAKNYENEVRRHIFTSGVMREVNWTEFDLTQLPTDRLAFFIACVFKNNPSVEVTSRLTDDLYDAGYIPFIEK